MNVRLFISVAVLTVVSGQAAQTDGSPFAAVFIDNLTESKLGSFPLDRALVAKAIDRVREAGAKGVVLKFFYDQPKNQTADGRLAEALSKLPVLLEARIDDTESNPNPLPERFFPKLDNSISATKGIAGNSGWIPLPMFAAKARDVGFVDTRNTSFLPMFEHYQGRPVKSLVLCTLELAVGETAKVDADSTLHLGKRSLRLDEEHGIAVLFPKSAEMDYVPFHEILEGTRRDTELASKIVIIGYDGSKIHQLETPIGPINAHRYWVLALDSAYRGLVRSP